MSEIPNIVFDNTEGVDNFLARHGLTRNSDLSEFYLLKWETKNSENQDVKVPLCELSNVHLQSVLVMQDLPPLLRYVISELLKERYTEGDCNDDNSEVPMH
jgi:hypothetical protein